MEEQKKRALVFSVALHILVLAFALFHKQEVSVLSPKQSITERVFVEKKPIAAQKPPTVQLKKQVKKKVPVARKKPAPVKKAPIVKKLPAKKTTAKKPVVAVVDTKVEDTLEDLEGSLKKLLQSQSKSQSTRPSPTQKEISLSIDQLQGMQEIDQSAYEKIIIATFRQNLSLPAWGTVDFQLDVLSSGKIASLRIVESQSKENAKYLESHIDLISLPPFSSKESMQTFHLSLVNQF